MAADLHRSAAFIVLCPELLPRDHQMEQQRVLATALEHEWGDLLFPDSACSLADFLRKPPPAQTHRPLFSPFFAEIAAWATALIDPAPAAIADLGGACGRFLYEYASRNPGIGRLALLERDQAKMDVAAWILSGSAEARPLPVMESQLRMGVRNLRPPRLAHALPARLETHTTAFHPRLDHLAGQFDVVACLNVVDHVADPAGFLRDVARLGRPGAFFLVAAPFDWMQPATPQPLWTEDLRPLLEPLGSIRATRDFLFPYRSRTRRLILFQTQTVLVHLCP